MGPQVGRKLGALPIGLTGLLLWVVASALAVIWTYTLGGIFRAIGNKSLGGLGVSLGKPFHFLVTADHDVMDWLNDGTKYGERAMIWGFTNFALPFVLIGAAAYVLGSAIFELGEWTGAYVRKALHSHVATRVFPVIRAEIPRAIRAAAQAVPKLAARLHALEHRVASLVHTAAGAVAHPIPRLGRLERDVANQGKRLKKVEKALAVGASVALVWTALKRLGLSWTRCNNTAKFNKKVCAANPNFWDDLFASAVLVAGTTSFVEFVKEAQEGYELGIEGLSAFIREL